MPFPFKHTKHAFSTSTFSSSTYTNPWHTRSKTPSSPTTDLRRSFKAFTHAENMRRAERNEHPFCTPAGRDRAFEKLMRLARGEEELHWDIDQGWVDEEEWYAGFVAAQMQQAEKVGEMHVGEEEREEDVQKRGKEHERKDSKEVVADKSGEEWRRAGAALGPGKMDYVDGQQSDAESMEDIREDVKSTETSRLW
jgi:hypothetical protein